MFCSVGNRKIRWYPLDFIEKEILTNVREGVNNGILSCTDVLLYGSKGVIPKKEAVLAVNKLAKRYWKSVGWSHCSLAAAVVGEDILREVTTNVLLDDNQKFLGVEVGIESGSTRIMKKYMPAKSRPYPPSEWPEVVEKAFSIFHELHVVPAATLVVGLPGENESDVQATIELIRRLRPYKSLIVPMFFVPMGPSRLGDRAWFKDLRSYHVELILACLDHDILWAKRLVDEYLVGIKYLAIRKALKWFLGLVEKYRPKAREWLMKYVNDRK